MPDFDRVLRPRAEKAFALLSKKWSGLILIRLVEKGACFNELARSIPGLSPRLLSLRLKELEKAGLVSREVLGEAPIRVLYRLTDKGRGLAAILDGVVAWAATKE